ncbi:MAG: ABC transporter ATP-binding protein [Microbacteriaceae bacterium]
MSAAAAAIRRKTLRRELLRRSPRLLLAALLLAAGAGAGLVVPIVLGRLVDAVVSGTAEDLAGLIGLMVAGAVAAAVLDSLGLLVAARVLDRLLAALRGRFVARALAMPRRLADPIGTGDLVSRASDDVAEVGEAIGGVLPAMASAGATIVVTLVGFAGLHPAFLLILPVMLPVHLLALRAYLRVAPSVYRSEREAMGARAAAVLGSLRAVPTVRGLGLEGTRRAVVGDRSWRAARASLRARIVQNRLGWWVNTAECLGIVALLVIGFLLVQSGAASVGEVTTALLFYVALFGPIGLVLFVIDDLQSALASLQRLLGIALRDDEPAPAAPPAHGEVRLRGATVAYGARVALDRVDLVIAPGARVAIVGASGAGKSTLGALVAGALRADAGTVEIGAAPVIAVTQERHVFDGTVDDNLRLAAPEASDAAIADALERIGADWVDALPDGRATVVGSEGAALTAAQQQHLALARVLLADPPVLVLDEPTAEAGSRSAAALDRAAATAAAGRTAIVIAHRLDQAASADRVLVMEAGRIVEDGAHDELVRRGGRYAELWAAWAQR